MVFRFETNLKGPAFRKLVAAHLAPQLRSVGFEGSGFRHARPTAGGYLHLLEIFADRRGGQGWLEAGVVLTDLPEPWTRPLAGRTPSVAECTLRHGLCLPNGNQMFDWGQDEAEARETLALMWDAVERAGLPWLERFQSVPAPLDGLTVADFRNASPALRVLAEPAADFRLVLVVARLHLRGGDRARARELADFGLSLVEGQRGAGLVPLFEQIRAGVDPVAV
jgi:hypothetical protein